MLILLGLRQWKYFFQKFSTKNFNSIETHYFIIWIFKYFVEGQVRTQKHLEGSVYRMHSRVLGRGVWLLKELSETEGETKCSWNLKFSFQIECKLGTVKKAERMSL